MSQHVECHPAPRSPSPSLVNGERFVECKDVKAPRAQVARPVDDSFRWKSRARQGQPVEPVPVQVLRNRLVQHTGDALIVLVRELFERLPNRRIDL